MAASTKPRSRQPRMPIEVRRRQALDAALSLISERGYGAVTMEAVAREADLAKPVIYNAYPGRAALLCALLDREEQRALEALAAAMPPSPLDPGAALLDWVGNIAQAIAARPATWRLMLVPPLETPEVVRERVQRGRDIALQQARSLTQSLLAERPALTALDPDLTAQLLLGTCEHAARLMIAEPDRYPPERLVQYAESVLRALDLR